MLNSTLKTAIFSFDNQLNFYINIIFKKAFLTSFQLFLGISLLFNGTMQMHASCPATGNLVTLYNENNGQAGMMFDIEAIEDVTILCFDVNLYTGTNDYLIYYKTGTHVGFESDQAAWQLIGGPVSVTSNGTDVPTYIPIPINITINAGERAAFYITCDRTATPGGGIEYTNGTAVGNLLASDNYIEVFEGTGKAWPFSTDYTPRQFNGTIYYDFCSSFPDIDSIAKTQPSCSNDDGEIQVFASGDNQPFTYSLNNDTPQSVPLFTDLSGGSYLVTVFDSTGCFTEDSVVLQTPDLPQVEAFGAEICEGSSAPTLNATGTADFINWYSSPDLTANSLVHQGEAFVPEDSTAGQHEYYVTSIDSAGICESLPDTVIFSILELPPPPVVTSVEACLGTSIPPLEAQGDEIQWYSSVIIDSSNLVYTGNIYDTGIDTTGTFTFYVTQTDPVTGCVSLPETATVSISDVQIDAELTEGISCTDFEDAQVLVHVFDGNAPFNYQISPAAGSQQDSLFSEIGTGTYIFSVEDNSGCIAFDTLTIEEPDSLVADITVQDLSCFGNQSGEINVVASGGVAPYTYDLNAGQIVQSDGNFDSLDAGTYLIEVTDDNDCILMDSVSISEPDSLIIGATVTDALCHEDNSGSVSISVEGGEGTYTFEWSDPNLGDESIQNNLFAGTYTVSVTDENVCTQSVNVTVGEPSPVSVEIIVEDPSLAPGEPISIGSEVSLNAVSFSDFEPGIFSWTPDTNLSCTDCQNPVAVPISDIEYVVMFTDENGCTATDTLFLEVLPDVHVFIPNVFSPNDDGNNDYFKVYGNGIETLELKVFSRWGELVFRTNDVEGKWDGTFNGQELPVGNYVYHATVTFDDNTMKRKKGSVLIVR